MNSRIDTFKAAHIYAMDLRPSELERLVADPKTPQKLEALSNYGMGGTLFRDDLPIAALGYFELWPGVYELWAFPSIHVEKYAMMYLRTVKRYIQSIEKSHNPIRLQTTSFADELHTNWMKFLGLSNETPDGMKNYSVLGQTFNMWSKVYEVSK